MTFLGVVGADAFFLCKACSSSTFAAFTVDPANNFAIGLVISPELYQINASTGHAMALGPTALFLGGVATENGTAYAFINVTNEIHRLDLPFVKREGTHLLGLALVFDEQIDARHLIHRAGDEARVHRGRRRSIRLGSDTRGTAHECGYYAPRSESATTMIRRERAVPSSGTAGTGAS